VSVSFETAHEGAPLGGWDEQTGTFWVLGVPYGHRAGHVGGNLHAVATLGMRGLYTHVSDRMRDTLIQALQARWDDSLRARAASRPHSPVPLLDELLAPHRRRHQADTEPATGTVRHLTIRTTPGRQGEVDLPNSSQTA
jgi:hypothetical protein